MTQAAKIEILTDGQIEKGKQERETKTIHEEEALTAPRDETPSLASES